MAVLFLLLGFILVVGGGKYLVSSSVQIARHYKLSAMVVGLTVVAFGTSAPELWVSMGANLAGHPDIAIGNILGSNIANIALVLAFVAVICPIEIKSKTIIHDWIIMIVLSVLSLLFLAIDGKLSTLEAAALFAILLLFTYRSLHKNTAQKEAAKEADFIAPTMPIWKAAGIIVLACVALSFGSDFLVKGASSIAAYFGVDERIISMTLIAFGTSIPELSTSVIAALKKEMDISVGNIIGSNIFNIGAVFGLTGMVKPINTPDFFQRYNLDMLMVLLVALLLLLFIIPLYKAKITRLKGLFFLLLYVMYLGALFYSVSLV